MAAKNIVRVGAFLTPFGNERLEQIAQKFDVSKGGLLELFALGLTDDEIPAILERGQQVRESHRVDGRKIRTDAMSRLLKLPTVELEKLLANSGSKS